MTFLAFIGLKYQNDMWEEMPNGFDRVYFLRKVVTLTKTVLALTINVLYFFELCDVHVGTNHHFPSPPPFLLSLIKTCEVDL